MLLFSFGFYIGLLSHVIRLNVEMHTLYSWFDYTVEWDETINGFRILIEFLKIQVFIGIGSCVHDSWFFDSSTFVIRQNHNLLNEEELEELENIPAEQEVDIEY